MKRLLKFFNKALDVAHYDKDLFVFDPKFKQCNQFIEEFGVAAEGHIESENLDGISEEEKFHIRCLRIYGRKYHFIGWEKGEEEADCPYEYLANHLGLTPIGDLWVGKSLTTYKKTRLGFEKTNLFVNQEG